MMNKPMDVDAMRAAMAAVSATAGTSLQKDAAKSHAELAQVSSTVGLAADRLEAESGSVAVIAMLREAESAGRLAFLAKHGSDAAYEAIRRKVEAKYRTPGGRWRGTGTK